MKVRVEFESGEKIAYENVERINSDNYKVSVYGENGILAILNKGDIKNLITEEN